MHEETSLTVGRVNRVLTERVRPAIHSARVPLEIATHQLPGEPIAPAEGLALDFQPFTAGSAWGPAWGTTWFRVRGEVPAEWGGKKVEALIDLISFKIVAAGQAQKLRMHACHQFHDVRPIAVLAVPVRRRKERDQRDPQLAGVTRREQQMIRRRRREASGLQREVILLP